MMMLSPEISDGPSRKSKFWKQDEKNEAEDQYDEVDVDIKSPETRFKRARIDSETNHNTQHTDSIEEQRKAALEKKQDILTRILTIRERELRELLYLESGANILDFDESSTSLNAALEGYHDSHRLITPRMPLKGSTTGEGTTLPPLKIQIRGLSNINPNNNNISSTTLPPSTSLSTTTPSTTSTLPTQPPPKPEPTSEEIAAKATKDANILRRVAEL